MGSGSAEWAPKAVSEGLNSLDPQAGRGHRGWGSEQLRDPRIHGQPAALSMGGSSQAGPLSRRQQPGRRSPALPESDKGQLTASLPPHLPRRCSKCTGANCNGPRGSNPPGRHAGQVGGVH